MTDYSGKFRTLDTDVVHAGSPHPRIEGAVVTPLFQSANYLMADESAYEAVRYIRLSNSPSHLTLHARLAAIESGEAAPTSSMQAAVDRFADTRAAEHNGGVPESGACENGNGFGGGPLAISTAVAGGSGVSPTPSPAIDVSARALGRLPPPPPPTRLASSGAGSASASFGSSSAERPASSANSMKVCRNMPRSDHWGGPICRSTKQKNADGASQKEKLRARWAKRAGLSSRPMPSRAYISSPTLKRESRYGEDNSFG